MADQDEVSADATIERADDLAASDPVEAMALLRSVVSSRLRHRDPAVSARASYLLARLLAGRGEYDAALGAIRSARRDWLAAGLVLDALSTDLGRASVMHELGNYRQAIDITAEMLAAVGSTLLEPEQMRTASSIRARAHNNLGNAWSRLGDYTVALHHYDVASNLFHALSERAKQAETDANRGLAYLKLGMAHRALDELVRAERALTAHGQRLAAAKCRVDIAETHLHLDQVAIAIDTLIEVRSTLEELNAVPELARLGLTMSNALVRAGLPLDAHVEATIASDTFADLSMVDESARATYLCATASMMIGETAAATAEFAAAGRLFADCGDTGYEARVWLAQAQLAQRTGDVDAARELAARAAERLEAHGEMMPAALARLLLADLATDLDTVADHLGAATDKIATLDIATLRLALELARARHERRSGRPLEAAQRLRSALGRIDPTAATTTGDAELRIALHAAGTDASDELVDLLLEQGTHRSVAEAWQWASLATARALNDFVDRAASTDPFRGADDAEPATASPAPDEATLLSRLYDDLASGPVPPDRLAARARMAERRLSHHDAVPVGGRTTGILSDALPPVPEGPVLHYHVLGTDLLAFVIREGQVYVRRLRGAATESLDLVRAWRLECSRLSTGTFASTESGPRRLADTQRVLTDLHRLLIDPVEDLIEDLYAQPLLVVAHQHLYSVPFEALHVGGEPLSGRFSLSFTYGLAAGQLAGADDRAPSAPVPGSTLVLAVPDDRAPDIALEAQVVADLRDHAEVFVGAGAMVRTLVRRAVGKEIVHIACHGLFRSGNPLFSGLRMADRWVTASELTRLRLPGALVVLSACASGRSSDTTAEPAGLAWALLAAGSRGVIASTWTVNDEVTVELMRAFYTYLAAGSQPRDALDLARVDVARSHPHPYYWASFRYICSPATALTEGLSL